MTAHLILTFCSFGSIQQNKRNTVNGMIAHPLWLNKHLLSRGAMASATKNFGLQQMKWADGKLYFLHYRFAISPWIDPYSNQQLWRERRVERRLEQCSSISAWCQWLYKRLGAEIHKCIHKLPVQLSSLHHRPGQVWK